MPRRIKSFLAVDLRKRGVRSVSKFGRYDFSRANPGLSDHRHRGAMEICFLERGRQTYIVGDREFHLRGGDVFLTFPNETHGTGGAPVEKGLLFWIALLNPGLTGGVLLNLSPRHSRTIWMRLTRSSLRHFRGTAVMKEHLDRTATLLLERATPLGTIEITNRLTAYLIELVKAREQLSPGGGGHSFQSVFKHIEIHLEEPEQLRISTLAELAGLSKSRFKAAFKQQVGTPPSQYVLRVRIDEAARRLRQGSENVTDVAFGLGFSSSQYFASVFKRFTNKNPQTLLNKRM